MTATTPEELTADLARIDLDLLVARAALLTRVDRKYVVDEALLADLVADLPADACVLEIDGRRTADYRSVYLDTPGRDSYHDAGRSRRRRWKVRGRRYVDTGASYLEVKTRGPRGSTVKERLAHPAEHLTPAGRAWSGDRLGRDTVDRLEPTLETSYARTTILLGGSGCRATLDTRLGFRSLTTGGAVTLDGRAVVETKSGSRPSEVDRLLWRRGVRPVRLSKYGVGMAALDPELPRLKWHHVLDRHLDLPRTSPRTTPKESR